MCERDLRRRAANNVICEIQGFQVALTKSDEDPILFTSARNEADCVGLL